MSQLGDLVEEVYLQAGIMFGTMDIDAWRIEVADVGFRPDVVLRIKPTLGRHDGGTVSVSFGRADRYADVEQRRGEVRHRLAKLREELTRG